QALLRHDGLLAMARARGPSGSAHAGRRLTTHHVTIWFCQRGKVQNYSDTIRHASVWFRREFSLRNFPTLVCHFTGIADVERGPPPQQVIKAFFQFVIAWPYGTNIASDRPFSSTTD